MWNETFTMRWTYPFLYFGWSCLWNLWWIGSLWRRLGCQWCCPTKFIITSLNLCHIVVFWFGQPGGCGIKNVYDTSGIDSFQENHKLKKDCTAIAKFWDHCCSTGFLQADHPGRGKSPVGIYGDDCRYNKTGEKLVALNFNCILQETSSG